MRNRSAPMLTETLVVSKRLACCNGGMFESTKSNTQAKNPIAWKILNTAWFTQRRTFTQNILTRDGMNGKPRYCLH